MNILTLLKRASLLCLLIVHVTAVKAVEIQHWKRLPLVVPLVIGQERIVFLDQNVRVGIPRSLTSKLRIQSTGGAIYLLAKEAIEPTRLQLQNAQTGEIILIDIAATQAQKDQQPLEPVKIVADDTAPTHYGSARPPQASATPASKSKGNADNDDEDADEEVAQKRETPIPVVLTRYAAQMLYAPLRTVEPVDGIAQVKVDRRINLSTLLPTLPVEASSLGAWQLDDYWVTAIKLRNQTAQRLSLDPRELMGDFVTAAFQHPYLGYRGDASDTTTLYLVTRGYGLSQALLQSASQADPRAAQEATHER